MMRPPVQIPGVRIVQHTVERGSTPGIHALAGNFESKMLRGESAARAAMALRAEGFEPDVICGHSGWGETVFLKDVWPRARLLSFIEFIYASAGADVGFDPEFPLDDAGSFKIRSLNAASYLVMEASDWLVTPTRWQAAKIPRACHGSLSVIHDGVDTDQIRPNAETIVTLGRGSIRVRPGDEVITFVNRNLEPYRGYHMFMRALPEIMRRRPQARVVLVGGSGVSYGPAPEKGRTYRDIYLDEVKADIDLSRVHLVGSIPFGVYLQLLQVSAAHVYLTYPFVLSWSLLEAMAAGCAIVGSATPPVEEVVRHGESGVLVDFFSTGEIAAAVVDMLAQPRAYQSMRMQARQTVVDEFDLKRICLPRHLQLIDKLAAGASEPL